MGPRVSSLGLGLHALEMVTLMLTDAAGSILHLALLPGRPALPAADSVTIPVLSVTRRIGQTLVSAGEAGARPAAPVSARICALPTPAPRRRLGPWQVCHHRMPLPRRARR